MPLSSGTRLGSYSIVAQIGAGGMGEVYRATDTKLGREVAIKVLPEGVAGDAQRMGRFQREAQVLASLNHPHIAAIYGLEESAGAHALVMELVEGPTLAERISQGAMPLEEALPLARQIVEAIEYAHDRGIVHRDLKPSNIKVKPDGTVKVLDFGLAKALEGESVASDISSSPTISVAASRAGIILGTAAYMSPEQAKGKSVDRRADIWSFGVVLFEMLAGHQMYIGETATEVLAAVILKDPPLAALPGGIPQRIRDLLARCLEKDPKQRLQAIGEARIAIEKAIAHPEEVAATATSGAGAALPAVLWQRVAPWVVTAFVVAASVLAFWAPWHTTPPTQPQRLSTEIGADASMIGAPASWIALSQDGSTLAFTASKGPEQSRLFIRRLDQLQAAPLGATEGAQSPFFSPDGQWIAFFAGDKLKKISITGGAVVTLCDVSNNRGGVWAEDDTIIFASSNTGLLRVNAAGGTPAPLTTLDTKGPETTHRWPQVLPGGREVLFTAHRPGGNFDEASIAVAALATGEKKIIHRGGYFARYLPSGHLVYLHAGTLFAAPFDLNKLEITGPAVPAAEKVTSNVGTGAAQFAFSKAGTLAYVLGEGTGVDAFLLWMDRSGKTQPLRPVGNYLNPRFSPDGRRLAIRFNDGKDDDVWVHDLGRDTLSRLTFESGVDDRPQWTPDGSRIAFSSSGGGKHQLNLYWKLADGTGDAQRLTESSYEQLASSWHPSGKFLAFFELNPQTNSDLMILPMEGSATAGWKPGKPFAFLITPFAEVQPAFSPDGRWLAYAALDTGIFEVYVRPFPGPGGKWQVSTSGGQWPTWSRNGRELFYRNLDQRIMVARYSAVGDSFRADKPEVWSETPIAGRGPHRNFDLHPDGKRFAVLQVPNLQGEAKRDKVVFLFNFFDELRRIAPPKK